MLKKHFGGLGYGWSVESVRLGLAVLFRGGAVEIGHQGRKYRQYSEPPARQPFVNNPAFRTASFSPREALDLKVLAAAARMYEELTGRDVNIEEGAIAQAFKQMAVADREKLLPLTARLQALRLPGATAAQSQLKWVEGIIEAPPDECVKTLASEGKSFQEGRRICDMLDKAANDENVDIIRIARRILDEQWPVLAASEAGEGLKATADELLALINGEECLQRIDAVRSAVRALGQEYRRVYATAFEKRMEVYRVALDTIKGRPEWLIVSEDPDISPEQKDTAIAPLRSCAETEMDLPDGATVCRRTGATLAQLESDTLAVEAIAGQVMRRLIELGSPEEKIERVPVSRLYPARIGSEAELDEFLKSLRERLLKVLAAGGTIILE